MGLGMVCQIMNKSVSLSGQISKAYPGAAGKKCKVSSHSILLSYLFAIRRFLLVCDEWGRVWSTGGSVSLRLALECLHLGAAGEKCKVTFSFHVQFFQLLTQYSPFLLVCGEWARL